MKLSIIAAACLGVASMSASASPLSDFSAQLTTLRSTCTRQAAKLRTDLQVQQYQDALDAQNDALQVRMNARVNSVSMGDREVRDQMLSDMQASADTEKARDDATSAKASKGADSVKQCVADAIGTAKAEFGAFKATHKKSAAAATDVMAAWLANMQEVTFDNPEGSAGTSAAWKAAAARAELSE